jgi:hypothetical protein
MINDQRSTIINHHQPSTITHQPSNNNKTPTTDQSAAVNHELEALKHRDRDQIQAC